MNLTWIISQSQSERDQKLFELLHQKFNEHHFPSFACIVPTRRRAQFLFDGIQRKSKSIWKPPIYLIHDLAEKISQEYFSEKNSPYVIGESERAICVEEALIRLGHHLEYFQYLFLQKSDPSPWIGYPGILKRLSGFLSFLKANDLDRDFVNRLILDDYGNAGPKDNDLTLLLNGYNQILEENEFMDSEDQMISVISLLEQKAPVPFLKKYSTLVLDNLTFFTRIEEKFILKLISKFENVILSLDYDDHPKKLLREMTEGRENFKKLQYRYYLPLKSFFEKMLSPEEKNHEFILENEKLEPHVQLTRRLFGATKRVQGEYEFGKIKIHIVPCHNRVEEIRFICREIKKLVQEKISLEKIHIIFPQIEHYISIIYEIFPQYGIPFSITRGLSLNSSPIAIVVRSMLKIPQGYQREDLFRFFSSNLITYREKIDPDRFEEFLKKFQIGNHSSVLTHEEIMIRFRDFQKELKGLRKDSFHFDIATLDRYARSANIRGGGDVLRDWFIPLDQFYFRTRIHGEKEESKIREHFLRIYTLILRQLFLLDNLKSEFQVFHDLSKPEEVLHTLQLFIRRFRIPENVVRRIQDLKELQKQDRAFLLRRDMRALYKVFEIIGELQKVFQLKRKIQGEDRLNQETALEWTTRMVHQEFSDQAIMDPLDPDVVQITESLEVRGIDLDYCFFGGLTADDYPRIVCPDFILPETPNARFRMLDSFDESRFLFAHVLKNSKKKLVLTHPRVDGMDEKERSPFLEDLLVLNPALAQMPWVNGEKDGKQTIFSSSELEIEIAKYVEPGLTKWSPEFGFLTSHHPHSSNIFRSIGVELNRSSNIVLGPYDGILGKKPDGIELEKEKIFSVSQLDKFAACPQHYFFAQVLGLEPLDEVTEEMEADEFGNYVHSVLEKFFRSWLAKGHQQICSENLPHALSVMRQCAEEILGSDFENIMWERQKSKIMDGLEDDFDPENKAPGILRRFLEFEAENSKSFIRPQKFEWRFGFDEERFQIGDVFIRGKMDRIDQIESSSPLALKSGYLVYDYKTGFIPKNPRITQGLSFQLPVYLSFMQQKNPQAVLGSAYYNLKDPSQLGIERFLGNEEFGSIPTPELGASSRTVIFSAIFSQFIEDWVGKINEQLKSGSFHYAFSKVLCGFCNFRNICRRDPQRLKRISEEKPDAYYIPEQNKLDFQTVHTYLSWEGKVKEKIEKKKDQKKIRMGSAEIHFGNEMKEAYQKMPSLWQKRLHESFREVHGTWDQMVQHFEGSKKP